MQTDRENCSSCVRRRRICELVFLIKSLVSVAQHPDRYDLEMQSNTAFKIYINSGKK